MPGRRNSQTVSPGIRRRVFDGFSPGNASIWMIHLYAGTLPAANNFTSGESPDIRKEISFIEKQCCSFFRRFIFENVFDSAKEFRRHSGEKRNRTMHSVGNEDVLQFSR